MKLNEGSQSHTAHARTPHQPDRKKAVMKSRLTRSRAMNLLIIVVILTLPLMYSGMFTWAYEKPMDKLDQITAVVVNEDHPADATLPNGDKLHLDLGSDLSHELFKADAPGFRWVPASSADDARAGLEDGTYQVALWIPSDLSSNLAQLSQLKNPERSMLRLETNDATNYLTGTMARSVALTLQNLASEKGASRFDDNLLLSLSTIHTGMTTAADGAKKIADGDAALADGAQALKSGADQAAAGAHTLTASVQEFAAGSQRLNDAIRQYTGGVATLTNGASELSRHMGDLDSGLTTLHSGLGKIHSALADTSATSLTGGLHQLMAATAPGTDPANPTLADATTQLEAGASQLSTGATALEAGAQKLADGVNQLHGGADAAAAALPQLRGGIAALRAQTQAGSDPANPTIRDGVNQLSNQLDPTTPNTLGYGATQMAEVVKGVAKICTNPWLTLDIGCIELKKGLAAKGTSLEAVAAAAEQVEAGVKKAHTGSATIEGGLDVMFNQSAPLAQAFEPSAPGTPASGKTLADFLLAAQAVTAPGTDPAHPTLADGAAALHIGAQQLAAGGQKLAAGAQKASEGTAKVHDGLAKIADGVGTLTAGVTSAENGSAQLAAGAQKLTDGTNKLAAGSHTLNDNSPALTSGSNALTDGATKIAAGSSALADGTDKLAAGATTARDGAQKVADGARELHDKLADAANQVPQISTADGEKLASVAAAPIHVDAIRTNPVSHNGTGFAPFFMCLAMWVGGIAMYLLFPALDRRRHPNEKFFIAALRSLRLTIPFAVAQSVLVVVGLELLLDLDAKKLGTLFVLCMLTALCFLVLNQGFIALMGYRGRFASVLMLLLQITSAGATFPVETAPHFFQFVHPFLPMTYCAESIRGAIAGTDINLFANFWVVGLWALLGFTMTMIGAHLHPGEKPMEHDPAFAFPGRAHQHPVQSQLVGA